MWATEMPAHGIQAFESEHSGIRARDRWCSKTVVYAHPCLHISEGSVRANELNRSSDDFTRPRIIVARIECMMALRMIHYFE